MPSEPAPHADESRAPVRGSPAYFEQQFATAKDGILIFDVATTRVLDVNPFLIEWLGYPAEAWLGHPLADRPAWQVDGVAQAAFGTLLRKGYVRLERIDVRGNNHASYVVDIVANLYTVDGHELGQLNIRDVTAREEALRALRESEERFRLFVDSVRDYAFILLDLDGRVTSWNSGAEKVLGYTAQEIIGLGGAKIFTPEDLEQGEEARERRTALLHGRAEDERWHVRKNGTRFWSSGVLTAVQDEHGNVRGFAKVLRDITERREAEELLAAQTEQLIRSNTELQQFAYVTSHDLQEPLRTVSTFTELLRRQYSERVGPEAEEYLGFVTGAVTRMNALIRDLLEYSRTGNSAGATVRPLLLEEVLQSAILNLQTSLQEANAELTNDPLPTVLGSHVQLVQVFQNVIGNAIKYRGDKPPQIHVSAIRKEQYWEISVSDNGIGIAPQYHERIFGVFKRLHGREVPGTGIGLALCRKVIDNHGGRIWVESDPGRGSIFRFTFPAAEE
jgi:PAS domain S-box-containing protein